MRNKKDKKNEMGLQNRIITVGGSAGSLQPLLKIIDSLNTKYPVSVFVVMHGGGDKLMELVKGQISGEHAFEISFAKNDSLIKQGYIYLTPPDRHVLLQKNRIIVNRGPRVNLSRPSIDLLFRSAAVAYVSQTIGVLLSGSLYDGVAGLQAVKQCGGITVVQEPANAAYPDLPRNALEVIDADYIEPFAKIGSLLERLVQSDAPSKKAVPRKIALENQLDLKNTEDISKLNKIGSEEGISCPECNGPLWNITKEKPARFRCHTGHSFTLQSLLEGQSSEIERALWVALKTLEEKRRIQEKMSQGNIKSDLNDRIVQSRLDETKKHIKALRNLIMKFNVN